MYSLTFRVRVTTPRSMDEMERRTQQARRFIAGEGRTDTQTDRQTHRRA